MTWILSISIGPVGGFIAAGRRSRDLWWGSTWLSECVVAAGKALLNEAGCTLLLPSPERLKQVGSFYQKAGGADYRRYAGRVANKLVIEAESEEKCKDFARLAHNTAKAWLVDQVERNRAVAKKKLGEQVVDARVQQQLDALRNGDFLEFRAGWAPIEAGWTQAVELATERRDASPRLFTRPASVAGVHKCDLDPGRDSVLVKLPDFPPKGAKPDPRELRRGRVGIRPGEKLDLLYLARRISLFTDSCPEIGELPFPPLGRVAAQPYLHGLFLKKPNLLQFFVKELSTLAKSGSDEAREDFFRWCSPCKNPESELALTFPYDPGLLYEGEWEAKVKELGRVGATEQLAGVQKLNGLLLRIREEMGGTTPIPYYALVEMDGDGVGHGLRGKDQRQWEAAIKQLDAFSDAAAREIEKAEGVPFYAAADELLFYVPVDKALDAVTKLSTLWDRTVGSTVLSGTTLSGGVVIVHVKDDLTLARDAAGKALKAAKKARRQAAQGASESLRDTGAAPPPWLRVEEHPRAGSPRAVTGPLPSLVEQLRCWAQDRGATAGEPGSAEESLSLRTAHILHEHLLRFQPLNEDSLSRREPGMPMIGRGEQLIDPEVWIARGAILRQLASNEDRAGGEEDPTGPRGRLRRRVLNLQHPGDVEALLNELLIAARIGRVAAQRESQ